MKKFTASLLLTFLLALSLPSLALVASESDETMERRLERYAKMSPEGKCSVNKGAGIDTKAGQEYKSACIASYEGAREAAQKYLDDKAKAEEEIKALTSMNAVMCGANRTTAAQKSCFDGAAANYAKAAKLQKKIADDLFQAYRKAQKWRDQNAKALVEYRNDLKKIQAAEADANRRAEVLRNEGDPRAAAFAITQVQRAPSVVASGISVVARDGNASSLSEYKDKFSRLTQEQTESQEHATNFADEAQTEANNLIRRSQNFQEIADSARARAAALPTGGTDPNGSGVSGHNVPTPTDARAARAEFEARQKTAANGGNGAKADPAGSNLPSAPNADETTAASTTSSPNTNATGNAAAAAPAAAGMMGGSGAVSSGGNGGASPDPFAGMNGAAGGSGGSPSAAQNSPPSAKFGEVLGTGDNRKEKQVASGEGAERPEAKTEKLAEQVLAGGGLSSDVGEEKSGASSSPAIRGADGKPIRTGFTSAAGGSLQSNRQNMDRDAAPREQFSPDLKSGAVSIAGSELKSAIQSLAEEFGAADLDLNLGDLGPEEKTALAPLESGEGGRNLAPVKGGRSTASAVQSSDTSIQDETSAALFSRARSAHERALKRGNLILGIRKKL